MSLSRSLVLASSISLPLLLSGVVCSQDYPNRAIRIVTAPLGGNSDFDARQIAQAISGPLGQPVVVDNRAVIVAAETAAKSLPDGYTLFVSGGSLWITPLLQKVSYDAERDFSPVSLLERQVNVVTVHPSLPVKSIWELIALAKARPGELNYGSGSVGGSTHLAVELFKHMAGVNFVRVAYRGPALLTTALVSGEVQLTIFDAGSAAPHLKSGKLRALAVTSAEPSALAPGLPTVAASGLPGYESIGISGIFVPARTPGAVINRLNQEIGRALNRADLRERFLNNGEEVIASSPEQFAALIKADTAKIAKVIKDANIQAE